MNLPGFHSLGSAWLFALLIPLIILYFLKLKRPRLEVPSLALWQQVINDQRVNSPFQKFKRNILLLLQFLMLAALCLAAMQPFMRGGPEQYENLPVLIDCSASMAALDKEGGQSRLDVAREEVERLIDGLTGDQRLALIAVTSTGRRLTEFTDNKRILRKALANIETSDVPGGLEDAMRMTLAMSRTEPIKSVVILSDGNFPERVDFELPFKLNYQKIEAGGSNVGIIELNARRSQQSEWDVFVRIAGKEGSEMGGELSLLQNGEEIAKEAFVINDGESQRLSFRVTATSDSSLQVVLKPDSFDSLESDNVAWMELPEGRDLRVYTDTGLGAWRHALSGLENIDLYPIDGDESEPARYDVLISDTEDDLDTDALVRTFVGFVPPDLTGLLESSKGETQIVDWNRTEPLLQHVQLGDISIIDPPVRRADVVDNQIEELGYEIIAWGDGGPLLLKQRDGIKLSFYFLFHTDSSTLPFRLAFPITVANTVNQGLQATALSEVRGQRTGVLDPLTLLSETEYGITGPQGGNRTIATNDQGLLTGVPASSVGEYKITDGGDVVRNVGAGLLSPRESSLVVTEEIQFREVAVGVAETTVKNDRPLWKWLAIGAFVILLVEWWYFQRSPIGT